MFKKSIEAKAQQRLSGADRKKIRRLVKERFPGASDADIDVLLPPKADIMVAKLSTRVQIYSVEGAFPVFFDIDGRGTEIFPTVFALWQAPEILPSFTLKSGEVSHFILGGADLMFPGISIPPDGLPSFLEGEKWAVKVPGNMAPIAVGSTTMSSAAALKAGFRGKALKITHYYRDSLWESVDGHFIPNEGFLEDVVIEDPALLASQTLDICGEGDHEIQNDCFTEDREGSTDILGGKSENIDDSTVANDIDEKVYENLTSDVVTMNITDTGSAEELSNEHHHVSPEEVNALLDMCLLQALHTSVKDKDLPMPGSVLWSSHVLPCRPPGVTLDIKKSSHKKLSKWLQSKSTLGLISAREDKHKKEIILLSINRAHPEYTFFKPEKRQPATQENPVVVASESSRSKPQLEIMELYKSSSHLNPIILSVGADIGKFYTAQEATDIVFGYVENENLVMPTNKAVVVLDAMLCDALYKGTVKKGSTYPSEIHKKDLGATFLNRMQVHHMVSRGNESAIRKGAIKTVQLLTERRQGNKKVTRLSGLESFLMDAETLASELQKKFACSTTMAELPGKKGHEVIIQGGVIEDLGKYLVEHYGVPKRFIEVLDKTKR